MTYHNEFDKHAAQWLRNAFPGHTIDQRSIADVTGSDLVQFRRCHFFAGIGGWELALDLAGWPDDAEVWTGSCPCQPFSGAGKGLGESDPRHLWPEFRRLIDERKPSAVFGEQVASAAGRQWLSRVRADLEAMGYAIGAADLCAAGVGAPHIRQRLYWGAIRIRDAQQPGSQGQWPCLRSGPVDRSGGIETAAPGDAMERMGYAESHDERWQRGREIGRDKEQDRGPSSHTERLPDTNGQRCDGQHLPAGSSGQCVPEASRRCQVDPWSRYDLAHFRDGKTRRIMPGASPLAAGVSARVVKLRGYGNSIVPQLAAAFIRSFIEAVGES